MLSDTEVQILELKSRIHELEHKVQQLQKMLQPVKTATETPAPQRKAEFY